jgi:hypothetical protein
MYSLFGGAKNIQSEQVVLTDGASTHPFPFLVAVLPTAKEHGLPFPLM